jgi:hypothetical protein
VWPVPRSEVSVMRLWNAHEPISRNPPPRTPGTRQLGTSAIPGVRLFPPGEPNSGRSQPQRPACAPTRRVDGHARCNPLSRLPMPHEHSHKSGPSPLGALERLPSPEWDQGPTRRLSNPSRPTARRSSAEKRIFKKFLLQRSQGVRTRNPAEFGIGALTKPKICVIL